jgi:hyperosmotically inducible protein
MAIFWGDLSMKTFNLLCTVGFLGSALLLSSCQRLPTSNGNLARSEMSEPVPDDQELRSSVLIALQTDRMLKYEEIAVSVNKGSVRISGALTNQTQLEHADAVVRGIVGVHTVHDELSIKKMSGDI